MFTGLVEAVGEVVERQSTSGGWRLVVASPFAGELTQGDSVAVNGVCLTVVVSDSRSFQADIGPETDRVTTLGQLGSGRVVNLERPLGATGRFGGHFVQGHVDGVGRVEAVRDEADCRWLTLSFPLALAPFLIRKGSIAVDGISLTIAGLYDGRFDVQIVPFTLAHTNVSRMAVGDSVNIECDMVGKYVVRAAELAGLTLTGVPSGEVIH